ncbi:MAG: site-specific integrase [Sutterellaceae bacterium]|nr:site-specific integrase [Burkholderiaceae bacterium]MCX8005211.1 site-specific integrase [Burkholderiaceae bacterium]MDW8429097.1 site-specific integrase [Sutterellaceae bacterium]
MASVRKRGQNQYQVEVRRRGYPRLVRTFQTVAEAKAWARQVESSIDRGDFVDRTEAQRTTLREALERYAQEVTARKRSRARELNRIRWWQRQPLAARPLASLRGMDFAAYRDSRRQQGLAEGTIRLELALVSHVFETARKEWGMEGLVNPVRNIRMPSCGGERDRRLLPGEYERLRQALADCGNPWMLPAFELAIETGLRQAMLLSLRWDWVDLQRRIITIPAPFRAVGNKGVPAHVPLSPKAVNVIAGLPRSIDGRLLPLTQNALLCAWKRVKAKLKLDDLRWHDLRHEATSRFFEKGLNVMEVASITGHKSLNMLRRYTHLSPDALVAKLAGG